MSDEEPEKDAEEAPEPAPEEKPRRKKKRKAPPEPAAEAAETAESEPLAKPPPRRQTPAFAHDFPSDPALDALVAAFEAGDYARVRKEAPALARSTDRDDVRAAARELRRRLDPDPLAAYLLGIAAVLLVFLAGWYWLHPHTP